MGARTETDMHNTRLGIACATARDVILSPSDAMALIKKAPTSLLAIALVFLLFCTGSFLQRHALHHVQALTMAEAFQTQQQGLTARQQGAAIAATEGVPVRNDVPQWLIAFCFVFAALLLSAGWLYVYAMLMGGTAGFSGVWSAVWNIAIPSLGLYFVVSGAIVALKGPAAFASYLDLTTAVPSLFGLASSTSNAFWSPVLASLNPFSAWAIYLYALALMRVTNLSRIPALAGALITIAGGALLQGVLAAVST